MIKEKIDFLCSKKWTYKHIQCDIVCCMVGEWRKLSYHLTKRRAEYTERVLRAIKAKLEKDARSMGGKPSGTTENFLGCFHFSFWLNALTKTTWEKKGFIAISFQFVLHHVRKDPRARAWSDWPYPESREERNGHKYVVCLHAYAQLYFSTFK